MSPLKVYVCGQVGENEAVALVTLNGGGKVGDGVSVATGVLVATGVSVGGGVFVGPTVGGKQVRTNVACGDDTAFGVST